MFRIEESAQIFVRDELSNSPDKKIKIDAIVTHLHDLYPDLDADDIAREITKIVEALGGSVLLSESSRHSQPPGVKRAADSSPQAGLE